MHVVAMTSRGEGAIWVSGLYYWSPKTLRLIHAVQAWRERGLEIYFSIDAGPNVHLLCEAARQAELDQVLAPLLKQLGGSSFLNRPGEGAWIVGK